MAKTKKGGESSWRIRKWVGRMRESQARGKKEGYVLKRMARGMGSCVTIKRVPVHRKTMGVIP
jgi:hypothetical protein